MYSGGWEKNVSKRWVSTRRPSPLNNSAPGANVPVVSRQIQLWVRNTRKSGGEVCKMLRRMELYANTRLYAIRFEFG